MGLFSRKKSKDTFLPIQAPPSCNPTPSPRSSKGSSSNTLHKPPPPPPRQPSPPPDWPSHMHYKCSRPNCRYPNPPQCASGTYTCASCRKGTYFVTPAMAESAVVLKQKVYKFDSENRRRMKMMEEESEKLREMRDLKRYKAELEGDQIWREEDRKRETERRFKEEKKTLIIKKQEHARRRREEEERRKEEREMREYAAQFAVYEPSIASSIDYAGDKKRKVSLSDFPMPPSAPSHKHLNPKSSSSSLSKQEMQRRQCISGDRLRSKSSATSFRRPPPRQAIPEEFQFENCERRIGAQKTEYSHRRNAFAYAY